MYSTQILFRAAVDFAISAGRLRLFPRRSLVASLWIAAELECISTKVLHVDVMWI